MNNSSSPYFEIIKETSVGLLTLRETITSLTSAPDNLLQMSREELDAVAKNSMELAEATLQYNDSSGLTIHQIAALRLFTANFVGKTHMFSLVNYHLRNRQALPAFVPYIWLLLTALKKCPVYRGSHVYRGINVEGESLGQLLTKYRLNQRHHWRGFTSTSASLAVPEKFLGEFVVSEETEGNAQVRGKCGVIFYIELRPGARIISDYSNYPEEVEVLLPPNFTFEVVSWSKSSPELYIIGLRELESDDVILDFTTESSDKSTRSTLLNEEILPTNASPNKEGCVEISEFSLHEAAKKGHVAQVVFLLENGVDVNCRNKDGWTPLHWASANGVLAAMQLLTEAGARVNDRNNFGSTPLHCAASNGEVSAVSYLLSNGADASCQNSDGWFPLHDAVSSGNPAVAQLLIQSGANVDCQANNGFTPLHWAAAVGKLEMVEFLVRCGADKRIRDKLGKTAHDKIALWLNEEKVAALSELLIVVPNVAVT